MIFCCRTSYWLPLFINKQHVHISLKLNSSFHKLPLCSILLIEVGLYLRWYLREAKWWRYKSTKLKGVCSKSSISGLLPFEMTGLGEVDNLGPFTMLVHQFKCLCFNTDFFIFEITVWLYVFCEKVKILKPFQKL